MNYNFETFPLRLPSTKDSSQRRLFDQSGYSRYVLTVHRRPDVTRIRKGKIVAAPRCGSCGRALRLEEGVVAASSYGQCCSAARRAAAQRAFGLRPLTNADFSGPYLLPRSQRSD